MTQWLKRFSSDRILPYIKKPINILVLLIAAFFSISNYIYIKQDALFTGNDGQSLRAVRFYRMITTGKEQPKSLFEESYPPLMPVISAPFIKLFAKTSIQNDSSQQNPFTGEIRFFISADEALRYSLIPFGIIFLLAMYGIGKHLGNEYSGIAVMCLAASSPHILNLSRHYYLDFPQTALSALALYFLYRSNRFSDRLNSILFALCFSAACWIKWSAAFFMIFPFIWASLPGIFNAARKKPVCLIALSAVLIQITAFLFWIKQSFQNNPAFNGPSAMTMFITIIILPAAIGFIILKIIDKKMDQSQKAPEDKQIVETVKNIYTSAVVFIATVLPFYFARLDAVKERYTAEMIADAFHKDPQQNLLSAVYSVSTMFSLSLVLTAIGIIVMFIFFKDRFFDRLMLVISIAAGFLVMMKIGHSELRYYVTLVIFTAPIAGYWIFSLKRLSIAAMLPFIAIMAFSLTTLTFSPPADNRYFSVINTESRPDLSHPAPVKIYCSIKPQSESFNFGDALQQAADTIKSSSERNGENQQIYLLAHPSYHIPFINDSYEDALRKNNLALNFIIMLEPEREIDNILQSLPEGGKAVFIVVSADEASTSARTEEIKKHSKNITISDRIVDFGNGLNAKIITAE